MNYNHTIPAFILVSSLAILFVISGCASSEPAAEGLSERPTGFMSGEEVNRYSPTHLEEALHGAPGVRVEEVSGGFRVYIRGHQTLHGDNQPLYVIDGRPVNVGAGGLIGINPSDVQSIRVLRSASEIGMYGVRGANGVIEITTRRGGS